LLGLEDFFNLTEYIYLELYIFMIGVFKWQSK